MKKMISLLAIAFLSLNVFSQSNEINEALTFKTWVDGESREINGYEVMRINGADYGNQRNSSHGMITSVAYHDADANHESAYLEFYITRYEQSLANMKWFMIIIRDQDDDEKVLEEKLDYKAAEMPNGNFYWNYSTLPIPETIQPPFYVYIRDRNIPNLTSFKFKIE